MKTIFPLQTWFNLGITFITFFSSLTAIASAPKEAIVCTTAPSHTWIGEKKIRQIFQESKYIRVNFKVSHGKCYEFYAIAKDGTVVEAYYEPVSGDMVRFNRVKPTGDYASSNAPAARPASTTASTAQAKP